MSNKWINGIVYRSQDFIATFQRDASLRSGLKPSTRVYRNVSKASVRRLYNAVNKAVKDDTHITEITEFGFAAER